MEVLRGSMPEAIEVVDSTSAANAAGEDENEDTDEDVDDQANDEDMDAEGGDDDDVAGEDDGGENVVLLAPTMEDHDTGSESEEHSPVEIRDFRAQLEPCDTDALTLWRHTVFLDAAELTGECALAVVRWVETGAINPVDITDEMLLCVLRCLARGHAMFDKEEDLVTVFMGAVRLTAFPECVGCLLERGALRAMIRGLQSSAYLLLEPEDKEWFETERLVSIYRAFKTLWTTCYSWRRQAKGKMVTSMVFKALGRWLRSVPLEDLWMGEDDILVFWVLIPLWPHYLDHLADTAHESAAEERGRFKEICNWVLWPNDPVVENSGYRLMGHLDFDEDHEFSLRFLVSEERFRWIVTPQTKQRYLQYRVRIIESARRSGDEAPLVLVVERETPLKDLCRQLGVTGYGNERANLLSGITVNFQGTSGDDEDGIDHGGPSREAIPLMFNQLFDLNHGLFQVRDQGETTTVEPRWCANKLVPDFQAQFELCGVLIGLALVYQAYVPAHFSRCFLKHAFGLPRLLEDAPDLVQQLKAMDEMGDALEDLCLTFSVDDATTGNTVELKPGGAEVPVTVTTASEYKKLRTEWELEGRLKEVMPLVLTGLHRIVPPDVMEAFRAMITVEELDILLAGHGINVEDWRKHTDYDGYAEDSDMIRWFWEAVESFTPQEREDLWTFISGSKGVPPGGFGHLTNAAGEAIRFTIVKVEASPNHLPVAHTCGYQLDLAQYETAEDVAQKLRQAMSHRQGFGLA